MSSEKAPTLAELFRTLWYESLMQDAAAQPVVREEHPEDVPCLQSLPEPDEVVVVLHATQKGPVTIHIGRAADLHLEPGTVIVFQMVDLLVYAINTAATAARTMQRFKKYRIG